MLKGRKRLGQYLTYLLYCDEVTQPFKDNRNEALVPEKLPVQLGLSIQLLTPTLYQEVWRHGEEVCQNQGAEQGLPMAGLQSCRISGPWVNNTLYSRGKH